MTDDAQTEAAHATIADPDANQRSWKPLVVLGLAQFLMVLDSAVMNVSVSQLVDDFDTEVSAIQAVITLYSLVMAATMITGGKVGDRLGRRRAFRLGLVVYGVGSALTAVAWSVPVLIGGWSVLEGLGAAMVLPALAALVGGSYEGQQRAVAYGVLGGLAGTGVAVGPIVGGFFTATLSWRLVFVGEALLVVTLLVLTRWLDEPPRRQAPSIDVTGALLSASGLSLVVLGVLQSSSWGWVTPRRSPIEPFGIALTPFVVFAGVVLVWLFTVWQDRREANGDAPLLRLALLRIDPLRAGLNTLFVQNTVLLGLFFTLPLYLQLAQGLDALETGIRMLPMSILMMTFSMAGPLVQRVASTRQIVRSGLILMFGAGVLLTATIDPELNETSFAAAMAVLGMGVGLLASQLGNVVQSSVGDEDRSEVGGLQYTWQNLGSAVGTALVGSILLGALTTSFIDNVEADQRIETVIPAAARTELEAGLPFVPSSALEDALKGSTIPASEHAAIVENYEDSQLRGLRIAILGMSSLALIGLFVTRAIPSRDQPVADRSPPPSRISA